MRLIKHGHACIRIEHDGAVIVVDPGGFTEPESVEGATAVWITHEHADHYDVEHLRRADAPVFTIEAVAARLREDAPDLAERLTVVAPGDSFDVGDPAGVPDGVPDGVPAGIRVEVVGEKHAVIHPELPHFDNSGYLFEVEGRRLFHPGDALSVPPVPVDLLFLPVSAPWLKASECIDFARDVGAPRSVGIHDMVYSEAGLGLIAGHLKRFLAERGQEYDRVLPGQEI